MNKSHDTFTVYLEIFYQPVQKNYFTTNDIDVLCTEKTYEFCPFFYSLWHYLLMSFICFLRTIVRLSALKATAPETRELFCNVGSA